MLNGSNQLISIELLICKNKDSIYLCLKGASRHLLYIFSESMNIDIKIGEHNCWVAPPSRRQRPDTWQ